MDREMTDIIMVHFISTPAHVGFLLAKEVTTAGFRLEQNLAFKETYRHTPKIIYTKNAVDQATVILSNYF